MTKPFRSTFIIAGLLALSLILSGCQTMSAQQRSVMGTTLGSVAGALVGSQIGGGNGRMVAMALGAAVGGLVGNQFADYLNEQEQASLASSTQQALLADERQSGSVAWESDEREGVQGQIHYGEVVAASDSRAAMALGRARGQDLSLEEQRKLAQLSSNTNCRATRTSLSVEDRGVADGAVWCRTAEGDYKPLNMMAA